MVLRVRIRSAKLLIEPNNFSKISSYVVLIGGGNKFRTSSSKDSGRQPIWEQTIPFANNPPNLKLQVWTENTNGDVLVGQILIDLSALYQRDAYRIEPKTISLALKKINRGQIKVQLDFDNQTSIKPDQLFNKPQGNKFRQEIGRPQTPQGRKMIQPKGTNLQVGTVIAQGNKKLQQNQLIKQMQLKDQKQKPYQKPPTANYPIQQQYDYNQNFHQQKKGGQNLFNMLGNINNNKPNGQIQNRRNANNGWDL